MTIAGNGKTTLEDLARLAGVSISTVSRALNDQPLISLGTKKRIWALAREHDYPFRASMPSAPIGAEGSIVVVTPHLRGGPLPLSHPFFLELLAGIGEAARARGCDLTISHVAPETLDDLVAATATGRARGVIFLGQSMLHEAFNALADTGARFVVWGAHIAGQRYRSIGSDNLLGGRRATLHLARLGRRAIAFIGGTDPEAQQRRRGYLDALEHSGLSIDRALMLPVEFEFEPAEAAIGRILRQGIRIDGVVAASDLIALGAMRGLQRAGLGVPDDVSVVGYDDMMFSRLSNPAVTTIAQDHVLAGRLLVASVLDEVGEDLPTFLPTELIVRGTCGG